MSTTGQIAGGIVGGVIGAVVGGGPAGAIYGAQIGMSVGGLLDPPKGPTVEGPRLGDLTVQTSTYGQFIPRTYGTIGLSGNVFWLENNQLKEVVRKKKSGGKGGGSSSTVKTYTYFATFAVGLCEGPIAGVRRIWVGPDLVYDAGSDDHETIISSNQASSKFSIYLGTDTQQPDARMQAEMGVANCPAYRGLAYIVMKDLALANYGNSVAGAQVKVEIANAATIQTTGYQSNNGGTLSEETRRLTSNTIASDFAAAYVRTEELRSDKRYIEYVMNPASTARGWFFGVIGRGSWNSITSKYPQGPYAQPSYLITNGNEFGVQIGKIINGVAFPDPYMDFSTSDIIGVAIDRNAGKVWISRNGSWIGGGNPDSGNTPTFLLPSGDFDVYMTTYGASALFDVKAALRNGQFVYGPPSTYLESQYDKIITEYVPLSSIFNREAERSSIIDASDIDSTGLDDSVTGFKVTATGSIRNALEPLRGAWPFDVVQSGYQIKATSRGSASVVTIPVGELAIDTQLTESREMDSQLPQNVTVKYIDRERDYDANEQRAQRDNTEAVNSLVIELPVVLSADQSAQVAEKLIRIYALEKSDFSFTLPPPYRYLEPGDVVTISTDDADYTLRLVSVNQTADGRLECAGRPSSASTYTSIAPGDGGQTGGASIPLAGSTIGLLIDCPVIDEGLQDAPGFVVGMNGYSAGWPGGVLFSTADNGQTWDDLQAITGRATAGFASTVLTASAGNLIQSGGSLTVSLIGGTLESVTEAQMLNGANIAAYGANGRWEIIRFQNATLNVDGTYTLDTFWRGDKGTEWATGLHAVNDYFVLMTDPDIAFVGMPTDSIGQPRDYRSVTAGADIDSAASQTFTYSAVNLETLSGVHPRGSRSAGDLTVTWQRRTRVGGAWRDYVDASLGEAAQAYEVDVMDGSTVKRTLTSVTPSVLYTSAMQVTDFGSTQSSVTVNIYQLSAVVGRGYKLEATL